MFRGRAEVRKGGLLIRGFVGRIGIVILRTRGLSLFRYLVIAYRLVCFLGVIFVKEGWFGIVFGLFCAARIE